MYVSNGLHRFSKAIHIYQAGIKTIRGRYVEKMVKSVTPLPATPSIPRVNNKKRILAINNPFISNKANMTRKYKIAVSKFKHASR